MTKVFLIPVAAFAIVASAVLLFAGAQDHNANAGAGSAQNIAIDMDPTGNTATSLGSVEPCARINNNDTLDADEDAVADTVLFDITATGIPAEFPAIGFETQFTYDEGALTVDAVDVNYLLASAAGSSMLNTSSAVPDTDGNGSFTAGGLDTVSESAESGTGVLARVGISADSGANPSQYLLQFFEENKTTGPAALIIDNTSTGWTPDSVTEAFLALDMECGATPPPPPTPSPTPTPPPFVKGDVQCDGDVDAVDGLTIQRHIADLNTSQQPGCPPLGEGSPVFGDINCNGAVDAVDSLFILRFVASLGVNLPGGCGAIGQ